MLYSFAIILICGFTLGGIMKKLKLPALLGMIFTGVILGPYVLNVISPSILNISADLRQIALIVILIRAGLALDLTDLKNIGRPAVLMCFVPATIEIITIAIFAPFFFEISILEAAIMGTVVAAVSPAVVVPRMLHLIEQGYGVKKGIPQLIMTGASLDDIFVIVLFTSLTSMYQGEGFQAFALLRVPLTIFLGFILGILSGIVLIWLFHRLYLNNTTKTLLVLAVSFLLVSLETSIKSIITFSGLLAVMVLGGVIHKKDKKTAKQLSSIYQKIWVGAELLLFVLVGAKLNIHTLSQEGLPAVMLIGIAIVFRILGVFLCLCKTNLKRKEKWFTAISYLPKATVQAAIGSLPLAMGIPAGSTILTVAVVAILITAPLGAIGSDLTYEKFLSK